MEDQHVRLFYDPKIYVTAEHAADVLGISLEKADKLLSSPDTYEIVKAAIAEGMQKALLETLQLMARQRWPQDTLPVRVDCYVKLPPLPVANLFNSI
jgi:hypothetical protein